MHHLAKVIVPVSFLLLAACGGVNASSTTTDTSSSNSANPALANPPAQNVQQLQPTEISAPAAAALPTNDEGVSIVARVNETDITLPEFQRTLARYEQQQPTVTDAAALQASVLDTMIEQVLIEQAAAAQDITVTDEELDTEIQSNVALAGSDQAWQDWLAVNQYTEAEFRETLRETLITSEVLQTLTGDLTAPVPQVHARHILVETEAQANEVLRRLNNGEDFAALAAEYSLDETTARQGGDLGWFTEDELLTPSLGRVAFSLQPNMVAGPIQTLLGYHIIQTLELADRPIPEERMPEVMQARFERWVESLVNAATIERYL